MKIYGEKAYDEIVLLYFYNNSNMNNNCSSGIAFQ